MEGATLVVVYSNPSLPLTGRVYIHNGADFFNVLLDATNVLAPPAPSPLVFVKFTRFGADGETGTGTLANIKAMSDEKTYIGVPTATATCAALPNASLTQIAGGGSAGNNDSDWNGSDGGPLNQLWDTHTSTLPAPFPTTLAGAASYCVRYRSNLDSMNAVGYVLSVR
jgi:hypothetical protein